MGALGLTTHSCAPPPQESKNHGARYLLPKNHCQHPESSENENQEREYARQRALHRLVLGSQSSNAAHMIDRRQEQGEQSDADHKDRELPRAKQSVRVFAIAPIVFVLKKLVHGKAERD